MGVCRDLDNQSPATQRLIGSSAYRSFESLNLGNNKCGIFENTLLYLHHSSVFQLNKPVMTQHNKEKEAFKNEIKKLGGRKDLIPGIYNYCDRWCERCAFTSRCGNYSIGKDVWPDEEDMDLKNEKFWEKMSLIFETTAEMLLEKAEELGIDLSEVVPDENDAFEKAEKSELELAARDYGNAVNNWLDIIENQSCLS